MAEPGGDLHTKKESHMSVPVNTGVELHLKKDDVGIPCKAGEHYMVHIPMVATSTEGDSFRFRQEGKFNVHKAEDEMAEAQNMPIEKLRSKIGVVPPGEEYK